MKKNYILLTLLLCFYHNILTAAVEQKELNFKVNAEALLKGGAHYSFQQLSAAQFKKLFPEAIDFDSLGMIKKQSDQVIISKTAFVVGKAIGFFDHEKISNLPFVSHLMSDAKVQQISKNSFRINNQNGVSYKLDHFFDSDDISTLPHSRVIRAVTAAKKMDVLAQGASSMYFKEMKNFNRQYEGGVQILAFVPLKETKTLIISFQLLVLKKSPALAAAKKTISDEYNALQSRINSFKEE